MLDLDEQRDTLDLIGTSLRVWARHLPVFLVLAALVVVPVDLALGAAGDGAQTASLVGFASWIVVPALVTAMHVVAVLDLGHGLRPSIARSVRATLRVGPAVVWVVLLYSLGVVAGFLALIAPGLFLTVHWYFGAQVAVVDGLRGRAALRGSGALVAHRWGRVFGLLLTLGFLPAAAGGLVGAVTDVAVAGTGGDVVEIAAQCGAISFTALAGTLLFFDLRARSEPTLR